MPELIRSVVSRARLYLHDRRQSPRLRVRLMFTVSIPRSLKGMSPSKPKHYLSGHTRDISANGLAMLVPYGHLNGRHLAADGSSLEVQLELGSGAPVQMLVVPERYEHLDEAELGCAYLIGARILEINEGDRQRYLSYIKDGLARDEAA